MVYSLALNFLAFSRVKKSEPSCTCTPPNPCCTVAISLICSFKIPCALGSSIPNGLKSLLPLSGKELGGLFKNPPGMLSIPMFDILDSPTSCKATILRTSWVWFPLLVIQASTLVICTLERINGYCFKALS